MSYYTYYSLEVKGKHNSILSVDDMEAIHNAIAIDVWGDANLPSAYKFDRNDVTDSFCDFLRCDCYKWYECEDTIQALSKQYPHIVFIVDGEGEERDDEWRIVANNGEVEHLELIKYYERSKLADECGVELDGEKD